MYNQNILLKNGVNLQKSLELFGDIEMYNDTVSDFLEGLSQKLEILKNCKAIKDMQNYAIYVHSLKSDARYFGFEVLGDIAFEHELKSKDNNYMYIDTNFLQLENEIQTSIKILNQYLGLIPEENSNEMLPINNEINQPIETLHHYEENVVIPKVNDKIILVADDSDIVRNFVKKIFEQDYQVLTAEDGQEAVNLIYQYKDTNKISAILLDLNMPKVNGFSVLEYMKQNNLLNIMPVSIISGDSTKESIEKAFEYTVVDMIGKPFNEQDIKRVVEKTIYYKEMNQ